MFYVGEWERFKVLVLDVVILIDVVFVIDVMIVLKGYCIKVYFGEFVW